jgi:hypothetical protein
MGTRLELRSASAAHIRARHPFSHRRAREACAFAGAAKIATRRREFAATLVHMSDSALFHAASETAPVATFVHKRPLRTS